MVWSSFNCTGPPEGTRIVGGLPYRSTADLVWPCLATLIACTYTVLHLEVIADDKITIERTKVGFWSDLWRDTRKYGRTLAIELSVAIYTVLFPEGFCTVALMESIAARRLRRSLAELQQAKKDSQPTQDICVDWSKTHAHYIMMGGVRLCCNDRMNNLCNCKELMLDPVSYIELIKTDIITCHPPLSKSEILDHSKSSIFAKALASLQIIWFAATIILRLIRHLPISQLEVGIAGYVFLTLLTYLWYLDKPKSVRCGTRIYSLVNNPPAMPPHMMMETLSRVPEVCASINRQEKRMNSLYYELERQVGRHFWFINGKNEVINWFFTFTPCSVVAFGAVHIAAWNSTFPGPIDLWLWRASALLTTSLLPIEIVGEGLFTVITASGIIDDKTRKAVIVPLETASWTCIVVYIVARIVLMVEMCRCLFYLPPEAFINTWTSNLPHVG